MRLADFISANFEPILVEWVAFARSCGPAGEAMDVAALRDHAKEILKDIVKDLRTPQSDVEQIEKSKGNADPAHDDIDSAAEEHGSGRAESGFTVGEMVSEFRAMRASVIRLWTAKCGTLHGEDLVDLIRFNEAVDQALAESIGRYAEDIDHAKEMFLAILGHDLRTPLGAVITSSQFMLDAGELSEPNLTLATRIAHSARRMTQMVGDLLDFTRSQLGSGMPIVRARMDMMKLMRHAVDEIEAAHPERAFVIEGSGDAWGEWDSARISQALTNLLSNAVQHGDSTLPIRVMVQGEPRDVTLTVHNHGAPIPPANIHRIFSPFKRLDSGKIPAHTTEHLGLGLYIANRIVMAHGGSITISSTSQSGTSFTIYLPRDPSTPPVLSS
jgi:signal transduction histidine kinase